MASEPASIAELLECLEMDEKCDRVTVLGPDYYRENKDALNALPGPATIRAIAWEEWADESVELQMDANELGRSQGRAETMSEPLLDLLRAALPKCEMTDNGDDDDLPKCGQPAFGKVEDWDACDKHRQGQGYHWDTALAKELRALLGVPEP